MRVNARDGTRWKVGRQWWPEGRRVRWRGDWVEGPGGLDLAGADDFLAVLALIALAILLALVVTTVLLPLIALTVELVIVIVLFFAGVAGRLLFRRPWTVNARAEGQIIRRWKVVGFRASGRRRNEVAAALREGRPLPAYDG